MVDPLHIQPHPEMEKSYFEQREQFREENRQRIHALLKDYKVPRWNATTQQWDMISTSFKVMGETMADRGFLKPEDRAKDMLAALDAPVVQSFGMEDVPLDLWEKLTKQAAECDLFEKMSLPEGEGVDHDGPPIEKEMHEMSEPELLAYVDDAIERSKREI